MMRDIFYRRQSGMLKKVILHLVWLSLIFTTPNTYAQTSKQMLWSNIDLLDPSVKLGMEQKVAEEIIEEEDELIQPTEPIPTDEPAKSGGLRVLLPIAGAMVVGGIIYLLTKKDPETCPNPNGVDDAVVLTCGNSISVDIFANDLGEDLLIESIDLSGVPSGIDVQVGEGIITLAGASDSPFEIPYELMDECGNLDNAVISVTSENLPDLTAVEDSYTIVDNEQGTLTVLENDQGTDLNLISASSQNGASTTVSNNTILYNPVEGIEADVVTYTIRDACGQTSESTATVTLLGSENVLAIDDQINTDCASSLSFNPLNNDIGDNISIASLGTPTENVQLVLNDNGTIDVIGIGTTSFSFNYIIQNLSGTTSEATVNVSVLDSEFSLNNDSFTLSTGQPFSFDPTENDTGSMINILAVIEPDLGGVIDWAVGSNSITFTPSIDFNGAITFDYSAANSCGEVASATITITVASASSVIAVPDFYTAACNEALNLDVLTNDLGNNISVVALVNGSGLDITILNGETISIPDAGGSSFSFQYTIESDTGESSTAVVTVEIEAAIIEANDDNISTSINTPVTFSPLSNDLGEDLVLESVSDVSAFGTLLTNGSEFTFTPANGFTGNVFITYLISNACGNTAEGQITLLVQDQTETIIANDDNFTVSCVADLFLDVLNNDTGTGLEVVSLTTPVGQNVELIIQPDGTIRLAGINLTDFSFNYAIEDNTGATTSASIFITVSTTTLSAGSDNYLAPANTAINFTPLENDTGDNLTISNFNTPAGGTLVLIANTFTFTPNPNFSGTTSFTYTIEDECGQQTNGEVSILVQSIQNEVIAVPDSYLLGCNPSTSLSVLDNDSGENLSIIAVNNNSAATIFIDDSGQEIVIVGIGLSNFDFEYTISGTGGSTSTTSVSVAISFDEISAVDDNSTTEANTPVAIDVLSNDVGSGIQIAFFDLSSAGGTLSLQGNGTFTFTPNDGFSGETSFTYTIFDECGQSDTGTLTILVNDAAPFQAVNDEFELPCGIQTAQTLDVLANDLGDNLTLDSVSNNSAVDVSISNNTLVLNNVENNNFLFTYTIINGTGQSSTANVAVNIIASNIESSDDIIQTTSGEPITFNPLSNDTGNNIAIISFTEPNNGTLSVLGNGDFTFTSDVGSTGTSNFDYTIEDACGSTSTSTISITVNPCPMGTSFFVQDFSGLFPTCQSAGSLDITLNPVGTGPIAIEISLDGILIDTQELNPGTSLAYPVNEGGTYSILAYDRSVGIVCSDTEQLTLPFITDVLQLQPSGIVLPTDNTSSDGEITFNVNNSMGSSWMYNLNGEVFASDIPAITFTGLQAGSYLVLATDDQGCTGIITFILESVNGLAIAENTPGTTLFLYAPNERSIELPSLPEPELTTVEHPLLDASDVENGNWITSPVLSSRAQFTTALSPRMHFKTSIGRDIFNTRFSTGEKELFPFQISRNSLQMGGRYYLDKRNMFFGELGVNLEEIKREAKFAEHGIFDKLETLRLFSTYATMGIQFELGANIGIETNASIAPNLLNDNLGVEWNSALGFYRKF